MANEEKHYEILIEGDGFNRYPQKKVDVVCTKETLEIIAYAMIKYIRQYEEGGMCCCLAKEGSGVSKHGDFDYVFSDCM